MGMRLGCPWPPNSTSLCMKLRHWRLFDSQQFVMTYKSNETANSDLLSCPWTWVPSIWRSCSSFAVQPGMRAVCIHMTSFTHFPGFPLLSCDLCQPRFHETLLERSQLRQLCILKVLPPLAPSSLPQLPEVWHLLAPTVLPKYFFQFLKQAKAKSIPWDKVITIYFHHLLVHLNYYLSILRKVLKTFCWLKDVNIFFLKKWKLGTS